MNWESYGCLTFAYGNVKLWELIRLSHIGSEVVSAAAAKHGERGEEVTQDIQVHSKQSEHANSVLWIITKHSTLTSQHFWRDSSSEGKEVNDVSWLSDIFFESKGRH